MYALWRTRSFVSDKSDGRESAIGSYFLEALITINVAAGGGLETNLAFLAASGADCVKKRLVCRLAGSAALFAAGGLMLKALLCVKFLLAGAENKFIAAILADECFVLVHDDKPHFSC